MAGSEAMGCPHIFTTSYCRCGGGWTCDTCMFTMNCPEC